MGKVTGFLEIDRSDRRYEPASDRVRHFREFVLPLGEEGTRRQAGRCMECGIPFCHSACPVNNQIPDWNDLVYNSDWKEAHSNLQSTNNFRRSPAASARPLARRPARSISSDAPVTIKTIEAAIADRGFEEGWVVPQRPARKTGRKVAVIGSGPAGLACAQQLARAGHDVHLFDKHAKPGGLLRYGIPDFKMEKGHRRPAHGADVGRGRHLPWRRACRRVGAGERACWTSMTRCPDRRLGEAARPGHRGPRA
jgi:glutamate synthase (NADPH/NADH) small chain